MLTWEPDDSCVDDSTCSLTTPPPTATATAPPPSAAAPSPSTAAAAATPPPQLSYAEVTAVGTISIPEISLPVPYGGTCDRCEAPPQTYHTNYGYYCELCLRRHFYFNKHTDVMIIFD